ncbi:unnamed protein product [Lactuca saligna]|uniref:SWIM-type domain-containing protein n=1 Tax=Lactuca saligna TaxID=75948 RepID=A0AA35ZIV1_LACSI|nr:unnamed protein product [Lactuca saligna]
MLEDIRVYVLERMFTQKRKGLKWNLEICPSIRRKIDDMKKIQRFWGVIPSGFHQYESRWLDVVYEVDLHKRTCGCRSWQQTGIPCVHAISAILCLNRNIEGYVANWYTTQMFGSCYMYNIKPINGHEMWPTNDMNTILPEKRRRMSGRPKINRKKCISERSDRHTVSKVGTTSKCSLYSQQGHNKRKCPLKQLNAVDDSDLFDYHELFEGEGQGQGQGQGEGQGQSHGEVEDVGVDLEEEVGGDSEKEVGRDSEDDLEVEVKQVVDEEVVNLGNHHLVAPSLKRRKCGPSQRNTKLRLRRKVVTKDDIGGSLENPLTL